ncbi:MAG TPA: O-antigen ligase family protein, partial [Candidatus Omnitrophota bacterium]|nr:O-antigen ligase family protein [Candidatus Omnitrophota bacterium]
IAILEICVVLATLLWLAKRAILVKAKEILWNQFLNPPSSVLNKPIGFFLLACLLSVFLSVSPKISWMGFFFKTLEWFVIYFLILDVFKSTKHLWIALGLFVFTSFITSIDSIIQFHITGKDLLLGREIPVSFYRATAAFKHANLLGAYLTIFIPFCFLLFFISTKLRFKLLRSLIFIFSVWALIIAYSRGAWLAVIFSFCVIPFLFLWLKFFIKKSFVVLIAFVVIIPVLVKVSFFLERYKAPTTGVSDNSVPWRLERSKEALEMFKERPVFGYGLNTFMRSYEKYQDVYKTAATRVFPTYVHNCYLQILIETGVLGFGTFLWILYVFINYVLNQIKIQYKKNIFFSALSMGLLLGIFAFLAHSFVDTHFYSVQISNYLWVHIGLLMVLVRQSE